MGTQNVPNKQMTSCAPIITTGGLEERLRDKATKHFHLIDVREPKETTLGYIEQASLLPLSQMEAALLLDDEQFQREFGFEKPKKEEEVIFYCRSGRRSHRACALALSLGFSKIINYKGSWSAWSERNKLTEDK